MTYFMANPKNILITGASSGLGAALASLYAAEGVHLFLLGRDKDRLTHVATTARRHGATVHEHRGDVTSQPMMEWWVRECNRMAPLDLIIANAGISAGTGEGHDTHDQSKAIFTTNLHGVLNTIHPVLPAMVQRGQGQVAMISSLASYRGFAGAASYCASKAAVRVYGQALRAELAHHGVKISVVCPGFITTPMTDVNAFPMPFIMEPDKAAAIIRKGLSRNKGLIAFPWAMHNFVRLLAALPADWVNSLSHTLPRKGS